MTSYHILRAFTGSQTGNDSESFVAGTVADLSDDLAAIVVKEGWVELAEVTLPPEQLPPLDDTSLLPEDRETKVEVPDETKPAKPFKKRK